MLQLGIDDIANSLCLWAVKYLPETREFKYTYYIKLNENLKNFRLDFDKLQRHFA